MSRYKIAVAGLIHETNTFTPTPTTYADFDLFGSSPPILRGEKILSAFRDEGCSMGGILDALRRADVEIIPLLWCAAQPGGIVDGETFERLLGEIINALKAAGPVDAVILDLHGAMVVEDIEDAEYVILDRIRHATGTETFISAVLDFHGNISREMVQASDFLVAYRTYPHIDMGEAGIRTATGTLRYLANGTKPAKAFAQLPYLIPIHAQCTLIQPMKGLLKVMENADKACDAVTSLLPGFPPADIYDCGPSVLAYAPDQKRADAALEQVLSAAIMAEPAFAGIGLRSGDEAVAYALQRVKETGKPVIVVDTQDNPGAGATSDTMGLVEALLNQNAPDAVVAVIHDPDAAHQAHAAGIGATLSLNLGGKGDFADTRPLQGVFHVEALGNGSFAGTGAYYNNAELNFGPMALLRIADSGVKVIVGSHRAQAGTQAIFRHLGLDPNKIDIVGLKSSVHFLADFGSLTPDVVYAAFPGLNVADPTQLAYRHIRSTVRRKPSITLDQMS